MKEILNEKQLRNIRKRKQMTQKEFAERLGYSESYIQKLERGEKPISEEFANNLQKMVDLEQAYRKACENYYAVEEKCSKINKTLIFVCFSMIFFLVCGLICKFLLY